MKTFINIIKQNLVENRIWNEEQYLIEPISHAVERKTEGMSFSDRKMISKFIINLVKKEPNFFLK